MNYVESPHVCRPHVTTYRTPTMVELLTERYQEKYWTLKWKEC